MLHDFIVYILIIRSNFSDTNTIGDLKLVVSAQFNLYVNTNIPGYVLRFLIAISWKLATASTWNFVISSIKKFYTTFSSLSGIGQPRPEIWPLLPLTSTAAHHGMYVYENVSKYVLRTQKDLAHMKQLSFVLIPPVLSRSSLLPTAASIIFDGSPFIASIVFLVKNNLNIPLFQVSPVVH